MSNKENPTLVEQAFRWLSNNPLIAVIIVIGGVVIAVAKFTDSVEKIRKFLRPETAEVGNTQPKKKKPVPFDSATIQRVMSETTISLDTVQPSPEQSKVPADQTFFVSAVANYSFPDWVDSMELSLKVNRFPEDGRLWHSMTEKRVTDSQGRVQLSGSIPAINEKELTGYRLQIVGELLIFDNETGRRHLVAKSPPVYFDTHLMRSKDF